MSTPRDQVLAVLELLEAIILQLPVRNIFQAQRISGTWRNAINTSPSIQEKLFIKPSGEPVEPKGLRPSNAHNPIGWDEAMHYPRHFRLNNQFLNLINGTLRYRRSITDQYTIRPRAVTMTRVNAIHLDCRSSTEPSSNDVSDRWESLQHSFITQPPCTTVGLQVLAGGKPTIVKCSLRNSERLRYGDIWKAARGMLAGMENVQEYRKVQVTVTLLMLMTDAEAKEWQADWMRQRKEYLVEESYRET